MCKIKSQKEGAQGLPDMVQRVLSGAGSRTLHLFLTPQVQCDHSKVSSPYMGLTSLQVIIYTAGSSRNHQACKIVTMNSFTVP